MLRLWNYLSVTTHRVGADLRLMGTSGPGHLYSALGLGLTSRTNTRPGASDLMEQLEDAFHVVVNS